LRLREREQSRERAAQRGETERKKEEKKKRGGRREKREDRINKNKKFIHIATVNMYFYMLL
jgi:hypothetical protein